MSDQDFIARLDFASAELSRLKAENIALKEKNAMMEIRAYAVLKAIPRAYRGYGHVLRFKAATALDKLEQTLAETKDSSNEAF